MNKEEKINTMLDNAVQGLNHASDIYSRLGEITRLMPLIKNKSELVRNDPSSHDSVTYCDGFLDGYNSRIETVWHKPNEEPISFCSLLLIENNGGEFDLKYRFDPSTTKRWAYVKDLIPNMEE